MALLLKFPFKIVKLKGGRTGRTKTRAPKIGVTVSAAPWGGTWEFVLSFYWYRSDHFHDKKILSSYLYIKLFKEALFVKEKDQKFTQRLSKGKWLNKLC